MAAVVARDVLEAMTIVPRIAVTFPLVLPVPEGFLPADLATWPTVEGRLEYVDGRLEYMPPCGKLQQRVAPLVSADLVRWCDAHPEFVTGANEAGMKLGGDVRGADAAIWRAGEPADHQVAHTAPVLAVEIIGRDDTLALLQEKAAWYLGRGVETVWIIDPEAREAHVVTRDGSAVARDRLPEPASLPGLAPLVASFFRTI